MYFSYEYYAGYQVKRISAEKEWVSGMWGLALPKTARQNGSRPKQEARLWLLSTAVRVPSGYYLC